MKATIYDWPEDFAHENGNYLCKCGKCGIDFVGHKRRVRCKRCMTGKTEAFFSFRKVWDDTFWFWPGIAVGRDSSEPLHRRYCIVVTLWDRCLVVGCHIPKENGGTP